MTVAAQLLIGVGVLVASGLVCGAIAFAAGGNIPPRQRDPLDEELETLLYEEREL